MVSLRELKKDLTLSRGEIANAITPETRSLMQNTSNAGVAVASKYAFECSACKSLGLPSWYSLVRESIGPGIFGRKSDVDSLRSTRGIVLLEDLKFEPQNDSHLNITRDGLVCDHCKDSIYSD